MEPGPRRLLATMPLHAITSTYGEEGLRERFAAEIAPLPAASRDQLHQALGLVTLVQAADRREREPYINHLLRVATRIMSHYGVGDAGVVTAALLHDAVEDHAAEIAGQDRDPESDDLLSPAELQHAALAGLAAEFRPRGAARGIGPAGRRPGRRGDHPAVGAGPRRPRAVPGARPGQPAPAPVGA